VPRSLSRAARRETRSLRGRRRDFSSAIALSRAPWLYVLVPVGALFAPVPDSWGLPFLGDPNGARSYLQTAWQVQAAAVGFSLTVAVFAIQSAGSDRWGVTPRALARHVWADVVLALGVSSILVTGLALAGFGSGGPQGWAGSVAFILSVVSLLSVLLLWSASMHSVGGGALRALRVGQLKRDVERSVNDLITQRVAYQILDRLLASAGAKFTWFTSNNASLRSVRSGRAGSIRDIRLRRLCRIVSERPGRIVWQAYLGQACGVDSTIAQATDGSAREVKSLASCIRWAEPSSDGVRAGFSFLNALAARAVDERDSLGLDEAMSAYRECLLAYPAAWAEFGRRFDDDANQPFGMLPLPVLGLVKEDLTRLLVLAARSDRHEPVTSVLSLTFGLVHESTKLEAEALLKTTLDVIVDAHSEIVRNPETRHVARRLVMAVREDIEYGPQARMRDESRTIDERVAASQLVRSGYHRFAKMAKAMLDADDRDGLAEVLRQWSELGRRLDADVGAAAARVQFAEIHGVGVEEAQKELSDARRFEEAIRSLDALKRQLLLQLLAWAAHRQESSPPGSAAQLLTSYLSGDLDQLIDELPMMWRDTDLTLWITLDQVGSSGAWLDTTTPLLRAIAVAAIVSFHLDAPPTVAPSKAVDDNEVGLVDAIEWAQDSWPWDGILLPGQAEQRARAIIALIRSAAEQHRRHQNQRARDAPLAMERVNAFEQAVLGEYETLRVLPDMLGPAMTHSPRRGNEGITFLGGDYRLPREWFLPEAEIDISEVARQIGEELARSEVLHLFGVLSSAGATQTTVSADKAAQAGVGALRADGRTPSLIALPRVWEVRSAIRDLLEPVIRGNTRVAFAPIGTFDGVPVYDGTVEASDTLVVADISAAIRWEATTVEPEGVEVVVSVIEIEPGEQGEAPAVLVRTRLAVYGSIADDTAIKRMKFLSPT
jgi:hypothetical protein